VDALRGLDLEGVRTMAPRLKWGTITGLERQISEYFEHCQQTGYPPDVPSFCLAIGITRETYSYYVSNRYRQHTPTYVRERLDEDEQIDEEPAGDDLAALGTYEWSRTCPVIDGDGGDPRVWSEDQHMRRAVGDVLQKAALVIEAAWHREAIDLGRKGKSPIMPLFALKASHGYREDAPQLAPPTRQQDSDSFRLVIEGAIPLQIEDDSAPAGGQLALPKP